MQVLDKNGLAHFLKECDKRFEPKGKDISTGGCLKPVDVVEVFHLSDTYIYDITSYGKGFYVVVLDQIGAPNDMRITISGFFDPAFEASLQISGTGTSLVKNADLLLFHGDLNMITGADGEPHIGSFVTINVMTDSGGSYNQCFVKEIYKLEVLG